MTFPFTDAKYWIDRLGLKPHPEGGWFKEIYRSDEIITASALPARYTQPRNFCTSIYFLLEHPDFSAFHKLRSDELWHFYAGSPLSVYRIDNNGEFKNDILLSGTEGLPFISIRRNTWFAAEVFTPGSYSLIGCTVAPGFDFSDFTLADRAELSKAFPQHSQLIERLIRQ